MGSLAKKRPIQSNNIKRDSWSWSLSPKAKLWIRRLKIILVDLIVLIVDMIFDGITAHVHFSNCNNIWGIATLAFMVLPSLPTFIDYMNTKIQEFKAGKLRWFGNLDLIQTDGTLSGLIYLHLLFFVYFGGGFICVAVVQAFYTIICLCIMVKDPPGGDDKLVTKYEQGAYHGKFLECQLEAAPQCLLQVYFSLV